jgi:hypothetical protein
MTDGTKIVGPGVGDAAGGADWVGIAVGSALGPIDGLNVTTATRLEEGCADPVSDGEAPAEAEAATAGVEVASGGGAELRAWMKK